jgi:hypothetical protein
LEEYLLFTYRDNILKAKEDELKTKDKELNELQQYMELLTSADFAPHHVQQQRSQQQQLQQQQQQQQLNHNHNHNANHLRHDQLQQGLVQQSSQQQQQQQQHRLKSHVGAGDVSPQQVGRENLTYSPLIES